MAWGGVRLLVAYLFLQAFHDVSSSRPAWEYQQGQAEAFRSDSVVSLSTWAEARATSGRPEVLVQLAAANASGVAERLPSWLAKAITYPVTMHPGLVFSLVALDVAGQVASYNSSSNQASFLEFGALRSASLASALAEVLTPDTWLEDFSFSVLHLDLALSTVLTVGGVGIALSLFFGLIHKRYVTDRRRSFPTPVPEETSMADNMGDYSSNLIECCFPVPGHSCFYAFCCPHVRAADTYSAAGVRNFWVVILYMLGVEAIASYCAFIWFNEQLMFGEVYVTIVRATLLCFVFVPARRDLRAKFGASEKGRSKGIWDYLTWFCCAPCSIAQEGQHVDDAQGVDVQCCCELRDSMSGELVGPPVLQR